MKKSRDVSQENLMNNNHPIKEEYDMACSSGDLEKFKTDNGDSNLSNGYEGMQ